MPYSDYFNPRKAQEPDYNLRPGNQQAGQQYQSALGGMQQNLGYLSNPDALANSPYTQSLLQAARGQSNRYSAGLGEFGGAAAARAGSTASQLLSALEAQRMQQYMQGLGLQNQYMQGINQQQGQFQNREDELRRGYGMEQMYYDQMRKQDEDKFWADLLKIIPSLINTGYKGYQTFGGGNNSVSAGPAGWGGWGV